MFIEILVVSQGEGTSKNRVQHRKQISASESDEFAEGLSYFKETKKKKVPITTAKPSTLKKPNYKSM
jgi:hypothetical protein